MSQDTADHDLPIIALIALGANATSSIGGPQATLEFAFTALESDSVAVEKRSQIYRTPAFPAGNGPDFANAAAVLRTSMTANALLSHLHEVEASLGRSRSVRWGERTLDLDLLAYDEDVIPTEAVFHEWADKDLSAQQSEAPDHLIVPHPRLQDRSFVLVPLEDVAPEWVHPVFGKSISQLLEARPTEERSEVIPCK